MSSEFWKEVLSWLKECNIVLESFNEIRLFFEIFEESEDFFLINHVIILTKRTRLLNLKDKFRQVLCNRQFTDGITLMNNI